MKKSLFAAICILSILALAPTKVFSQWLQDPSEEPRMDHPDDYQKWFYGRRTFGLGYIPQDAWIKAIMQKQALQNKYFSKGKGNSTESINATLAEVSWINVGPINISRGNQIPSHAGRVNTVVTHPTNPNIAYLGAANGGVWKTTNAGQTWRPLTDNANSLAMGALAIDPTNPNILYCGTGEFAKGVGSFFGAGMLKTTDGGSTWRASGLPNVGAFSTVIVNPNKTSTIYAAGAGSGGGLYISDDAGASWQKVSGGFPPGDVTDISYARFNSSDMLYAAVPSHGIYLSQDGGKSWDNVHAFSEMRRMHVAVDPKNWQDAVALSVSYNGGLAGIDQTTDGGVTWSDIKNDLGGGGGLFGSNNQGWYDAFLKRDPENSAVILVGGISVWKTNDGGASWQDVGLTYTTDGIHPDQHSAAFSKPGSDIVYSASDGGIAVSSNRGDSYEIFQDSLAITESYGIAIDQTVDDISYTGNQDNGTLTGGRNGEWDEIAGGDGGTVAVDSKNHNKVFFIRPTAWAVSLYNGGEQDFSNGIDQSDSVSWTKPLVQDETNHILYTGSQFLYVLADGSSTWTKRTKKLASQSYISTIGPAEDGKTLLVGTTGGRVWSTTNNGVSFTDRTYNSPGREVTSIKVSPANKNIFYIALSGFGAGHVFKYTLGDTLWKNISSMLPDISCNALVIDDQHPTNLYVATDVGVFFSPDDGINWLPFGTGLPNVAVTDLAYHKANRVIRAGTHGRSMWEAPFATSVSGITTPTVSHIWYVGESAQVGWYGITTPVKIEISTDNAVTWKTITDAANGNTFNVATAQYSPSENALIRVSNGSETLQSQHFRIRTRAAGSTLATFSEQPLYMYDVAYDKDDNVLWVTNFNSSDPKIYKIDPDNGKMLGSITVSGGRDFTGIKYDLLTKDLFVHQSRQDNSKSFVYEIKTTGAIVHQWPSPSTYGTGINVRGDSLFLADRNNNIIHIVKKTNPAIAINDLELERHAAFGPRCITFDPVTGNILHTWTDFQGTEANATLYDSYILRLNKDDGTELGSYFVQDGVNSSTNVRGIELDARSSGTVVWVTVLNSGNSSKILRISLVAPSPSPLITNLANPVNASQNLDTSITFNWTAALNAAMYQFQLSTDPALASPLLDSSTITTTSLTVSGLEPQRTYYWRVRAIAADANIKGQWADTWSFTTKQTNAVAEAMSPYFYVKNYPNPFSSRTTIEYSIDDPGKVSIKVLDLLGREIRTLLSGNEQHGDHSLVFDGSSLSDGVYVIRLETNGKSISHLIHLVK